MNAVIPAARSSIPVPGRWTLLWLGMIAFTVILMLARESLPWAFAYPRAWQLPLAGWITAFMKWLINSFDLGLFTFKEFNFLNLCKVLFVTCTFTSSWTPVL